MTSSSCKICKWCPCPNSSHLITTSLGIVQKAVLAFCTTLVRPGQGWVTNSGFLVFPAFQLLIWDDLGLHTGALPNCITSVIVFGTWLWAWADICRAILVQESHGSQVSFLEKHTVVLSRNLQHDSIAIFAGVSRASFRSGEVAAVEGSLPCGNQAAMSDARLLWLISGTPFHTRLASVPLTHQGQSGLLGLKKFYSIQSFQKERMKAAEASFSKLHQPFPCAGAPWPILNSLLGTRRSAQKRHEFFKSKVKSVASKMGINTQTDRI